MANIEEKKTKAQNRENNTGIYRNHKDGVAYKLFSGKKESLSLYNCIMKTDYTNPDELEVVMPKEEWPMPTYGDLVFEL